MVAALLQTEKNFTNSADIGQVAALYAAFFAKVTSVRSLDFRGLGWEDAEAIALAAVLPRFGALTSLDVSENRLGQTAAKALAPGIIDGDMKMVDLSGVRALADSLAAMPSLTECKLCGNALGVQGWTIIFNALRDSPNSKITTWNLSRERLGPGIVKPLAENISVSGSLTEVRQARASHFHAVSLPCSSLDRCSLGQVNIDGFALPIKKLKGIEPVESLDFSRKQLGPASAVVIASLIGANPSLTSVRASPELQPTGPALTHFFRVHRLMSASIISTRRPRSGSSLR